MQSPAILSTASPTGSIFPLFFGDHFYVQGERMRSQISNDAPGFGIRHKVSFLPSEYCFHSTLLIGTLRHMLSNAMLKEYPVTQSNVNKVTGLDGFSKVKVVSIPSQVLERFLP